ncbi:MAG: hypothetical protein WCC10_07510 [Tumebacillaceae bacterium]
MKRRVLLASAILLSLVAVGCTSDSTEESSKTVTSAQNKPIEETLLSFQEYESLVKNFSSVYQYPNMIKVSDPLDSPLVVMVEKESTFGTRETLTLSGDMKDSHPQPTQNRFVYQDSKNGYVLYLDLIYLKRYLGNDMVSSEISPHSQVTDKDKINKSSNSLLSYHNVLIELTLISTNGTGSLTEKKTDLTKSVVQFLEQTKAP